jgi:hypothetical protein
MRSPSYEVVRSLPKVTGLRESLGFCGRNRKGLDASKPPLESAPMPDANLKTRLQEVRLKHLVCEDLYL